MKLMSNKYSEPSVSIALLLLRFASGSAMMINYGIKKFSNFEAIAAKGFPDPFHVGVNASLGLAVFAELVCSSLILLGLFTRIAVLPLIVTMCIALFVVKGGNFYGDGEIAGLYLAMFITLFLMGPGKYSVDGKLGK